MSTVLCVIQWLMSNIGQRVLTLSSNSEKREVYQFNPRNNVSAEYTSRNIQRAERF